MTLWKGRRLFGGGGGVYQILTDDSWNQLSFSYGTIMKLHFICVTLARAITQVRRKWGHKS